MSGKKSRPGVAVGLRDRGDEHHGIAHGDAYGAIGLAGHLAGLDGDGVGTVRKRLADDAQAAFLEVENGGRKHKGRAFVTAALRFSAAKPQALDELLVLLRLGRFQIIEELAALVHELHQPTPRGMIALVCGEVPAEAIDPLGQKRDLNFGRTGVGRARGGIARGCRPFSRWLKPLPDDPKCLCFKPFW